MRLCKYCPHHGRNNNGVYLCFYGNRISLVDGRPMGAGQFCREIREDNAGDRCPLEKESKREPQ